MVVVRGKIPFFGSCASHNSVLQIGQNAVRNAMPLLPGGLVLHTRRQVIQTLGDASQARFPPCRLRFEAVAAVVSCALSLHSLRHLAHRLQIFFLQRLLPARPVLAHVVCVCA